MQQFCMCVVLLATLLVTPAHAHAAANTKMFSAEVPVRSQAPRDQRLAAEQGLFDVLVRVSGSEAVRAEGSIVDAASGAIRYVEQFEYRELNDIALEREGFSHLLKLRYSERQIKALLRDAQQKFWPLNRPSVLVWLVEDSAERGKQLIGNDREHPAVKGLLKGADYRGLSIEFPLLDFQDQLAVSPEALWALDEAAVIAASERYRADVILVGKMVNTSSGSVWSNWQYVYADKVQVFDLRDEDIAKIGRQAMSYLANQLASMFSVPLVQEASGYYFAEITNIRTYQDYRALFEKLEDLDALDGIQLDATVADRVKIRFKSEASVDQLTALLALSPRLREVESGTDINQPAWQRAPLGSPDKPFRYTWRP